MRTGLHPGSRPGQALLENALELDDFSSNRHPALSFCWSVISAQTLRVCREGKPVPTFPDHALASARNAFDFRLDDALHQPWQIVVEPGFQHRPQHLLDEVFQ